jgi:hypothetical protein
MSQHLAHHMVAPVPNSMGDERIQSSMTWRHSSLKSNLSVETLIREIQVTMWDRFNPKVSPCMINFNFNIILIFDT